MSKKLLQLIKDNAQQVTGKLTVVNADTAEPTIYLYDVIDEYWGVSALDFNKELLAHTGKTVHLRINSPGGDVFSAEAMATAIRQHGNVIAHIDGYAASAATRVASAAKSVEISQSGMYMIHFAWTMGYGNKDELRQTADLLQKVDETIIADYVQKTGKDTAQISEWMAAETWFTAQEAVDNGFVDTIFQPDSEQSNQNSSKLWDLSVYKNAPKPTQPSPDETMKSLLEESKTLMQANANRLRLFEIT